jgi:hypothetical protein
MVTPPSPPRRQRRPPKAKATPITTTTTKTNNNNNNTIQSRTDIENTLGDKLYYKTEKALMQAYAMQQLIDSTLQRIGNSYETIFNMNRGLLHILDLIDKSPGGKIPTRELLRTMHSYNMHKHLKEAEKLGYIKRETERMPEGQKGGSMVVNSLTEEGHLLLKLSREYLK